MFENKVGININVPIKIYKKFKALCALEGQSMTSRIIMLMSKDMEEYKENKHVVL